MTLTAGAALSEEDAAAYLDDYASNVGSDPNFDANIADSIRVVRGSIGSYATILSLLPPIIAIVLALLTKEVYSSLYFTGSLCWQNRGLGRFFRSRRGSKKDMRKLHLDVAARKTAVLAAWTYFIKRESRICEYIQISMGHLAFWGLFCYI